VDLYWSGRDHGENTAGFFRDVPGGVEKNESAEMAQSPRDIDGFRAL
jgi:hypothetical protein